MNKSSFFIVGQHAVIEALRNPKRKVLRVFLTEESKKNIHRKNPNKNILEDVKVYFKSKKELDKYTSKEQLMHNGYIAEIEHLDQPDLKQFIRDKKNLTFVCLDGQLPSAVFSLTIQTSRGMPVNIFMYWRQGNRSASSTPTHWKHSMRGYWKYQNRIDVTFANYTG